MLSCSLYKTFATICSLMKDCICLSHNKFLFCSVEFETGILVVCLLIMKFSQFNLEFPMISFVKFLSTMNR